MHPKVAPTFARSAATTSHITLVHFLSNWSVITKDQWVLKAVQGVEIEYPQPPYQERKPHPPHLPKEDRALVKEEVEKLLAKGVIKRLHPQEARNGFQSKSQALNQFMEVQHFKMEGMHTCKDLLRSGDWMTKLDLKDVYFAIPIHQYHR